MTSSNEDETPKKIPMKFKLFKYRFNILILQVITLTELGRSHENRRIVMAKIGRYFGKHWQVF